MTALFWMLLILSLLEALLLAVVLSLFARLKRSEKAIAEIQAKNDDFLNKLQFNARLEEGLMSSFRERQEILSSLAEMLENRETQLKKLLKQAQDLLESPQTTRSYIQKAHRQGKSIEELARSTGLSVEEISLMLE